MYLLTVRDQGHAKDVRKKIKEDRVWVSEGDCDYSL